MNRHVYNASILAGVLLASAGAGMVYLPAGFITAGVLLIGLTIASARLAAGAQR